MEREEGDFFGSTVIKTPRNYQWGLTLPELCSCTPKMDFLTDCHLPHGLLGCHISPGPSLSSYTPTLLPIFWIPPFISGPTWKKILNIFPLQWEIYFSLKLPALPTLKFIRSYYGFLLNKGLFIWSCQLLTAKELVEAFLLWFSTWACLYLFVRKKAI